MLASLDILGMFVIWIAAPLVAIRIIDAIRAVIPDWQHGGQARLQRLLLVCLIIAVPMIAFDLYALIVDRTAVGRWLRGEGVFGRTRVVPPRLPIPHMLSHLRSIRSRWPWRRR